jgi:hypothetical protein
MTERLYWHVFIGMGTDGERALAVFGEASRPVTDWTLATEAAGVVMHYCCTFDHEPNEEEKEAIRMPNFSRLYADAKEVLRQYSRGGHGGECKCRTCENAHKILVGAMEVSHD